jgi:hypothetical protein
VARDYYVAADEDGTLLWIWRERLPVHGGEGRERGAAASRPWFLHGLFA